MCFVKSYYFFLDKYKKLFQSIDKRQNKYIIYKNLFCTKVRCYEKENTMLSGNALKNIILFALPIMLSSLLQYNYSLVDNIIVGRYVSTDALAAVGNVGSINGFIIGAAFGLTSGFTIPVAHSFGAGDSRKVAHYSGSSIVVSAILGTVIILFGHIFQSRF